MRTFSIWTLLFCLIAVFMSSCNNYGGELVNNPFPPQTFKITVSAKADKPLRIEVDGKAMGDPSTEFFDKSETFLFEQGKSKTVKIYIEGKDEPVFSKESNKDKAEDLVIKAGMYLDLIGGFLNLESDPLEDLGLTREEGKVKVRIIATAPISGYSEPVDFQFVLMERRGNMEEGYYTLFRWVGERYKGYRFGSGMSDIITFSFPEDVDLNTMSLGLGILKSGTDEAYLLEGVKMPADNSTTTDEYASYFFIDASGVTINRLSDIPYKENQPLYDDFNRDVIIFTEVNPEPDSGKPYRELLNGNSWSGVDPFKYISLGAEIIKLKEEQESPKTE